MTFLEIIAAILIFLLVTYIIYTFIGIVGATLYVGYRLINLLILTDEY